MPGYPQGAARNPQRSPLSHLTLDPEGKEFLCRARLVLRNAHVVGSIGHLCSGNLGVQKPVPVVARPAALRGSGDSTANPHTAGEHPPPRLPTADTWASGVTVTRSSPSEAHPGLCGVLGSKTDVGWFSVTKWTRRPCGGGCVYLRGSLCSYDVVI